MADKKRVKESSILDIGIETNLEEITNVEQYISQIVGDEGFYGLNRPSQNLLAPKDEDVYGFVSVNTETITEEQFFEIAGFNGKTCKSSSGLYQQSLLSRYMEAKKEQDAGYIQDIFQKAIEFRDNIERIKELKKNKAFMKEWRNNVGRINPESELKNTGSMRKIQIIESLSM